MQESECISDDVSQGGTSAQAEEEDDDDDDDERFLRRWNTDQAQLTGLIQGWDTSIPPSQGGRVKVGFKVIQGCKVTQKLPDGDLKCNSESEWTGSPESP